MLRPTTPPSALGQLDLCALIPTQYIPGLKEITAKIGCNPATRAALSAAIMQAISPAPAAPGAVAAPPPWYAPIAAVGGPALLADCICKGQPTTTPGGYPGGYYPPPPAPPWYQSPWVIGGILVGVTVLALTLSKPPAAAAAP